MSDSSSLRVKKPTHVVSIPNRKVVEKTKVCNSFEDGSPRQSFSLQEGKKHGVYKEWYPSGALKNVSLYRVGLRSGESKTWWENGFLKTKSSYTDDEIDGTHQEWYADGSKKCCKQYKNGRLFGRQTSWEKATGKVLEDDLIL